MAACLTTLYILATIFRESESATSAGLKYWAPVRAPLELRKCVFSEKGEKDHMANLVGVETHKLVTTEGQEHAIQSQDEGATCFAQDNWQGHPIFKLRLIYRRASQFWRKTASSYSDTSVRLDDNCSPVKYYGRDSLKLSNYRSHSGQLTKAQLKRLKDTISGVNGATGEARDSFNSRGGGFVVANLIERFGLQQPIRSWKAKESKSQLVLSCAYSTSNKKSSSVSRVNEKQPKLTQQETVGLDRLMRHWVNCYKNPNKIYFELQGLLKETSIWIIAYQKLSKNPGSLTKGPSPDTIDGTTLENLNNLKNKVLNRDFQWAGTRRVMKSLHDSNEKRPLGIPAWEDRVVQEVMRMILEPIYEPVFSNQSHGFRPGRSPHTALKEISSQFKACKWYIEGDIKKYFDSVNHNILIHLIKARIRDPLITDLIRSCLEAKIHYQGTTIEPIDGRPQGGIISPLLSNIYLHEFDKYMNEIALKYQGSRKNPKLNPEYDKLIKKGEAKVARRTRITRSDPFDADYRYIRYIRYADDFLIGVVGPREMAIEVKDLVRSFLQDKLKIELNEDKTHITHIANHVPFLGHSVSRRTKLVQQRYHGKWKNCTKHLLTIDADQDKMIKRLSQKGFCTSEGVPQPCFRLLQLPQSESNHLINSVLRSISEWWKIAGNRRVALSRTSFVLRYSLAMMYAAKFRLGTVSKVFRRSGKALAKPLESQRNKLTIGVTDALAEKWQESVTGKNTPRQIPEILFTKYKDTPAPESRMQSVEWMPKHVSPLIDSEADKIVQRKLECAIKGEISFKHKDPLFRLGWRLGRGLAPLRGPCAICGTHHDVEMHHIRSVKDLKGKDQLTQHIPPT